MVPPPMGAPPQSNDQAGLVTCPALCVGSGALNAFIAHYRDMAQMTPVADPL